MRIATTKTLVAAMLLALTVGSGAAGSRETAAGAMAVELTNGKTLTGVLRAVQPSLFLLQTADVLYEISGDEIAGVEGGELPGVDEDKRLIHSESFEVIQPNGDVEHWVTLQTRNESGAVWTYTSWGVSEREVDMHRRMLVYDKYAQRLNHRLEPREGTDLHDLVIDFAVPVFPGEAMDLAVLYREPCDPANATARVKRDGKRFTYSFGADFPEDRVHLAKVKLPAGARMIEIEPEPLYDCEFEDGRTIVWRRYFARGESFPHRIEYELP